jgi:hypothetical protein
MRFFKIVGASLFVIAIFNLIDTSSQMAMRQDVYACSEVTKKDPIDVQKMCNRRK